MIRGKRFSDSKSTAGTCSRYATPSKRNVSSIWRANKWPNGAAEEKENLPPPAKESGMKKTQDDEDYEVRQKRRPIVNRAVKEKENLPPPPPRMLSDYEKAREKNIR